MARATDVGAASAANNLTDHEEFAAEAAPTKAKTLRKTDNTTGFHRIKLKGFFASSAPWREYQILNVYYRPGLARRLLTIFLGKV